MQMQMQREIPASAAAVWQVLGESFGDLTWIPMVTASQLEGELGVGAQRVCRLAPSMFSKSGTLRERLVAFDRAGMTFAYEALELAPGFRHAGNRWSVVALGPNRCRVQMHGTFALAGTLWLMSPIVRIMVRRMGAATLRDLERRVTTSDVAAVPA